MSAGPVRAIGEAVGLAALFGLLWLLSPNQEQGNLLRLDPALVIFVWPLCALWCAVRLRMGRGPWWRNVLVESGLGFILGLLPTIVALAIAFAYAQSNHWTVGWLLEQNIHGIPMLVFILFGFCALSQEFLVFRIGVRLWQKWDRLRRTRLRWSLTHAVLTICAIGAGCLMVFALSVTLLLSSPNLIRLATLTVFLTLLIVIGLLVILPPSALLSIVFARYLTRRLLPLTQATNDLRAGNYHIRVPVQGEDEVAQLQTNFNTMAADMERTVRELQEERDRVSLLLEARRELVANVSHELRTPVATLRGYLESALAHWDTAPPPTLQQDLAIMDRETIRLQALIQDLFTLARAEVGKIELRLAPTSVDQTILRTVEMAAPLAWERSRVEVVSDLPAALPPALVDPSRLEQIVQNLLHNAIRHTPPGGIVAVAASAHPAQVTIQVKDTGSGIAAEELPRIWERFYRTESSRNEADGGTGLGLALVKEMAEAMGGAVAVESEIGGGSCFSVYLPTAPEQTPQETQPSAALAPSV